MNLTCTYALIHYVSRYYFFKNLIQSVNFYVPAKVITEINDYRVSLDLNSKGFDCAEVKILKGSEKDKKIFIMNGVELIFAELGLFG